MNQRKIPGQPPLPKPAPQPQQQRYRPPAPTPQPVAVSASLPIRRKYPFLTFLRKVYASLACLVAIVGVIWFIVAMLGVITASTQQQGAEVPFAMVFSAAVIALVPAFVCLSYGLFLMAIAEGIRVILDIQHNTLTTAREIRGLRIS